MLKSNEFFIIIFALSFSTTSLAMETLKSFKNYCYNNIYASQYILAAENGDLEKVKFYINNGMDPLIKNYHEKSALPLASKNNHIEIVKFLMDQIYSPILKDKENKSIESINYLENIKLALLHAVIEGHLELSQLLIEKLINISNIIENFKLDLTNFFQVAVIKENVNLVKLLRKYQEFICADRIIENELLTYSPMEIEISRYFPEKPLCFAIDQQNIPLVKEILKYKKFNKEFSFNEHDFNYWVYRNLELTKLLINFKHLDFNFFIKKEIEHKNINLKILNEILTRPDITLDEEYFTDNPNKNIFTRNSTWPYKENISAFNIMSDQAKEIINILLKYKKDIKNINIFAKKFKWIRKEHILNLKKYGLLTASQIICHLDDVDRNGNNLLHLSLKHQNYELFNDILNETADYLFLKKNKQGITPKDMLLKFFKENNIENIKKFLLNTKFYDYQNFDPNQDSILHYAINSQNLDLIKLIVYLYPELLDIKNNQGHTPMILAATKPEVLKFLINSAYDETHKRKFNQI